MLLILLASTAFVIGVAIEKSSVEEPHTVVPAVSGEGGHEEGEATEGGTEAPT